MEGSNKSLPIVVHDGIQTVSYSDHCGVSKFFTYGLLNQIVSFKINSCSDFVEDKYFGFTKKSTG